MLMSHDEALRAPTEHLLNSIRGTGRLPHVPSHLINAMAPTPHGETAQMVASAEQRTVVWRYLRALGAGAFEADDIAQETMLLACETDQESVANMPAFLLGVARNLWLRSRHWWQRRREREIAAAVDELWHETADSDGGTELVNKLRDCLEQLQPRSRQALDLHYHDGLPWTEVAQRIGMLPNGIKTLAQRARTALRSCIERRPS